LIRAALIFFTALLLGTHASARTFDFKSEHFASYFGGTYGPSSIGAQAFRPSVPTGATFDHTVGSNYSGEFGFVWAYPIFNFRFGAEFILPSHLSDVAGTDASGNKLFDLDSRIYALVPKASLEFNIKQGTWYKLFVGGGIGYGYVSFTNIYTFTAAGTAQYSPKTSFTESASGQATEYQGYAGFEFLLTDVGTAVIDAGYRYMPLNGFNHTTDTTTFQGTVHSGYPVLNTDGTARNFSLSEAYVGLSFRFYIML
jgi:hypothetical protein